MILIVTRPCGRSEIDGSSEAEKSVGSIRIALSGREWVFDAGGLRMGLLQLAPFLKADLLMLVAPDDEMARANPKVSRATFDLVPGFKRWVEIDGGHFGALYHPGERFDQAVAAEREFLVERLLRR